MKIYVVYFRTMEDSPEVTLKCVTTSKSLARVRFAHAREEAEELTRDYGEDGNWYEACIQEYDLDGVLPGDNIYLVIRTEWYEVVGTSIIPFVRKEDGQRLISEMKAEYMEQYPGITPFNEDEMHLEDPSVAIDVYFSIEPVTVE